MIPEPDFTKYRLSISEFHSKKKAWIVKPIHAF